MLRRTVLAALVTSLFACKQVQEPVAPPARAGTSSTPRFDGVYAAQVKANPQQGDQGVDLLRFTSDGRVLSLSVSSSQALEPALRLLVGDCEKCATGKYEVTPNGVLRFVMKSKLGSVEYAGAAREDKLVARWRSEINGATNEETFSFVHVVDDSSATVPSPENVEKPEPEAPSAPAASTDSLIPEGNAWYCFRAPSAGTSRCERKLAACEAATKTAASSHKNRKLTKCTKQATAYCYTVVQKSPARGAASCSATEEDCKADLAGISDSPALTLSACTKQ